MDAPFDQKSNNPLSQFVSGAFSGEPHWRLNLKNLLIEMLFELLREWRISSHSQTPKNAC